MSRRDGSFQQRDSRQIAQWVIQPWPRVRRDLMLNRSWVALSFALIVAWFLVSAGLYLLAENVSYADALYFTGINVTTVGFGDIHPVTGWGKVLSVANRLVGLILFALLTATIFSALQSDHAPPSRDTDSQPELQAGVAGRAAGAIFEGVSCYDTEQRLAIAMHFDAISADVSSLRRASVAIENQSGEIARRLAELERWLIMARLYFAIPAPAQSSSRERI